MNADAMKAATVVIDCVGPYFYDLSGWKNLFSELLKAKEQKSVGFDFHFTQ